MDGAFQTVELLEALRRIVRDAGEAILAVRDGDDLGVRSKADDSPVTAADLASQRVLLDALRQIDAGVPVISEEAERAPWSKRRSWRRFWLVDPLDGTREFVAERDEFTVNVALVEDGEPTLGAVHAPTLDRVWLGALSLGAWRLDGDRSLVDSADGVGEGARQLDAGGTRGDEPLVVASRSHRTPELEAFLRRLPEHRAVAVGSSLKFCLVAEAEADLYPRLTRIMEWDTAAGDAVLRAAGGRVVTADGRNLRYGSESLRLSPFLASGRRPVPWKTAWNATFPEGMPESRAPQEAVSISVRGDAEAGNPTRCEEKFRER